MSHSKDNNTLFSKTGLDAYLDENTKIDDQLELEIRQKEEIVQDREKRLLENFSNLLSNQKSKSKFDIDFETKFRNRNIENMVNKSVSTLTSSDQNKILQHNQAIWLEDRFFLQEKIKFLIKERDNLLDKNLKLERQFLEIENKFDLLNSFPVREEKLLGTTDKKSNNIENLSAKYSNLKQGYSKLEDSQRVRVETLHEKIIYLKSRLYYYKSENKFLKDHVVKFNVPVNLMKGAQLARRGTQTYIEKNLV